MVSKCVCLTSVFISAAGQSAAAAWHANAGCWLRHWRCAFRLFFFCSANLLYAYCVEARLLLTGRHIQPVFVHVLCLVSFQLLDAGCGIGGAPQTFSVPFSVAVA
jgi:hypothetical protein